VSGTTPPTNEPNILGTFASLVGLLSIALYFTGWIYRWAYFGFFQLEITTLDLPFESFLFVPVQVFLGSFWAVFKTALAVVITVVLIQLTLWGIQLIGNKLAGNSYQSQSPVPQGRAKPNKEGINRIVRSLPQFNTMKFPRSLLKETVIVAWILIILFWFARWQGTVDARRDAVNDTSLLPVVTLVTSEKSGLGRQLDDLSTNPPLKDFRIIGDKGAFDQLRGRETNDTTEQTNPRVWRLLINRNNQFYVFSALPKNASANERPLVLSVSEKQLMILSPEATK